MGCWKRKPARVPVGTYDSELLKIELPGEVAFLELKQWRLGGRQTRREAVGFRVRLDMLQ
jgi:hypothetical protein